MKLLFVSDAPQVLGGVGFVIKQITCGMAGLGCEVAVLRPKPSPYIADYSNSPIAFTLDTSTRRSIDISLSESIDRFKPDIVHVVAARWPVVSRVNRIVQNLPWVLGVHNLPPFEVRIRRFHGCNHIYYYARNLRFFPNALLWRIGLRNWRFARVICHSQLLQSRLKQYGCRQERIALVTLGHVAITSALDSGMTGSPFGPQDNPRLLTIAGMAHHKGIHDCIRAIAKLGEIFPHFRYLVIGGKLDLAYVAHLEKMVAQMGIGSHVSFIYNAREELKWSALRHTDLYIQPSHEEGFCLAFLDAAMVAPRLLGTVTGEMPLIAEQDPCCVIVPPGDVCGLEVNILRLMHTCVSPLELIARHARLHEKYSWSATFHHMLSLYEELLEKRGQRRECVGM